MPKFEMSAQFQEWQQDWRTVTARNEQEAARKYEKMLRDEFGAENIILGQIDPKLPSTAKRGLP